MVGGGGARELWEYAATLAPTMGGRAEIDLRVLGSVTEPGEYGHFGVAKRELRITKVLAMKPHEGSDDDVCAGIEINVPIDPATAP